MTKSFKYIYVPCESHKPIEEKIFSGIAELGNDQFIEGVKKHFANVGSAADKDVLKEQILQHNPQAKDNLSDEVMKSIMSVATVDIFPCVLPKKDNGFRGISVYIDDKGLSKKLPLNERVTGLVRTAGHAEQTFYGDAFIGRVFDDEVGDGWERHDFTESECSSDAVWIKDAQKQRANSATRAEVDNFRNQVGGGTNKMAAIPAPTPDEGSTEHYSWTDNDSEEIEVTFTKESGTFGKKDVRVTFKPKNLKVVIGGETLLDSELNDHVVVDDCSWSIVDGNLQVSLMKKIEGPWRKLVA